MATATEPIELIKSRIDQVDPRSAKEEIEGGDAVLIDVREPHEWDLAHLQGAQLVPPASVRERIAELAPDRSARVILYCATGNRSARAADLLQNELGYENVASVAGGIQAWTEQGLPVIAPEGLTPEQRMRYSRHTMLPEVGVEGQLKLLNSKVLLIGAGGLGAPSAFYLAAAGIGTLGIVDDDVVDESNLQRQVIHNTERVGMPKTESARLSIQALNPDVEVVEHNTRLDAGQHPRDHRGLRRDRRRRRQLPHPVPAQRRFGAAAQAGRLGLDPRLRRADLDLRPVRRALLPLPVPGAAAARDGAELRRRRACSA